MSIVFIAAEASPFVKEGGLGDVMGSLPKALASLGEPVVVCLPKYGNLNTEDSHPLTDTGITFEVSYQGGRYEFTILESVLPGSSVPIYFFDNRELFGQFDAVYGAGEWDFEATRFGAFVEAVFAFLPLANIQPSVLHCQDWHTAPIATRLNDVYRRTPYFKDTKSVLTIHNFSYQGVFGTQNWLRDGMICADAVTTVSPTYAQEIQTPEGGAGLSHVAQACKEKLTGILNGLDTQLFNPAKDVFLPQKYDLETVAAGKAANKLAIQKQFGLPEDPDVILIGMVTRLVEQKGFDILIPLFEHLNRMPLQLVVVGSGDPYFQDAMAQWTIRSETLKVHTGFHVALGQQVYAGADAFLMPSRFEPCGLGQMIALRYGTLPIVRQTGGLADTVFDAASSASKANGFTFKDYTPESLLGVLEHTVDCWQNHKRLWHGMVQHAMTTDFSWNARAQLYQLVYATVMSAPEQED